MFLFCFCSRPPHTLPPTFLSLPRLFLWRHQNKDLKSRVSHLEGSQRASQDSVVSKLNSRIQELEERLQLEER